MGGSGAMFEGVSGLSNHQTWMNVIGNNIANVNTTGFKENQFNFADVIYQTMKGASSAVNGGPGGTDFEQLGLGTQSGSLMTNEQQGSLQTTNLPTDFAIQGDGFFIVNDGVSNHYTRDSNFIVDGFGNLNQAATGFHLQGYGIKQVGNTVTLDTSKVQNLTVPQQINPAQQTNVLDLLGNLQSSTTASQTQSIGIYDSLGQLHNVILTFTPPSSAGGNWLVSATSADLQPGATISVSGGNASPFGVTPPAGQAGLHFNALGQLDGTVQPLYISFSNGTNPAKPQPAPPEPWIIPGTTTNTNATQATVQVNLNDPQVGSLTSFASPTSLSTQAVPDATALPNLQNPNPLTLNGNLNAVDEVQTISITGTQVATDTLQVSLGGQSVTITNGGGGITGAQIQTALNTLVGAGNSVVTPTGAAGPFTITFQGTLAGKNVPQLGVVYNPVGVGSTGAATSATTNDGSGTTQFIFNAADSTGLTHSYGVEMDYNSTTTTWTPTLVSVDGQGLVTGNLNSAGGAATTFSFSQPDSTGVVHTYVVTMTFGAGTGWVPSLTTVDGVAAGGGITMTLNGGGATGNVFDPANQNVQINIPANVVLAGSKFSGTNAAQKLNLNFGSLTNTSSASAVQGSATPFDGTGSTASPPFPTGITGFPVAANQAVQRLHIPVNELNNGNSAQDVSLDFSKITNNGSQGSGIIPPSTGTAGNSAGGLKDFTVDQNGVVHGVYTNGFTQTIGQILLATFENPAGLAREGKNLLQISADSGVVNVGTPGSGKLGTIAEGNIETSNVDLAQEFSNMILAERGFQANSRVITTADTMLSDLMSIKQTP